MTEPSTIRACNRAQAAGFICRCANVSQDIMDRCSGCKRVFYCSPKCQKDDWPAHKVECKQLKKVNTYDANKGHLLVDLGQRLRYFEAEQAARYRVVASAVGTNPYNQHPSVITYGKKCQVCFRTEFHTPQREFTACDKCKLAWWCSHECGAVFNETAHTASHCEDLTRVRIIHCFQSAYLKARRATAGKFLMLVSVDLQRVYIPPSSLSGWDDYKTRIFPRFAFAAEFTSREFTKTLPEAPRAVDLLVTESTSIVATLLSALEIAIPDLPIRQSLCIHVVGAAEREIETRGMTEELLHYLPKLKTATIIYVGPEVRDSGPEGHNLACKEDCTPKGRRRFIIRRSMTYHKFSQTDTFRANPPDLVAGFHTGMGEVDTAAWRQSLRVILDRKVPALFTSYSLPEAMYDTKLLRSVNARFIKDVERNKWRGPIPKPRELQETVLVESSHYTNNYWFMVKGCV
ncbi:MYND-type domain-containing protein [Mycena chlorophos]|uniref:MYND-type domain-containing protein n=1 Tax=Mycena chlorophos TaxID=658473 RepID=A0A8H6STG5_MYCCL|nr:MYND-type domain-containing protein [Mycena chlorophos]